MGRTDQTSTGVAMLGAALVAIASAGLDWNTVSRQGATEVLKGTETSAGLGTFGFGFVLLALAAVLVLRGRRTGGLAWAVAGTIVASFLVIVDVYSVVAPGEAMAWLESEQLAAIHGISEDRAEAVLLEAIDRGELRVTAEAGPWAGAGAGLAGVAAGVAGARRSRRIRDQHAGWPPAPLGP